jgi:hypothetical protein
MRDLSNQRQAGACSEFKITYRMIVAGVRVLRASGALIAPASSDPLLVLEILEEALGGPGGVPQDSEAHVRAKKIAVLVAKRL